MPRPLYFRSDFESDASTPLLFFCGCIIACCAFAIGAMAGFEYRDALQREVDKLPKPRPVVQNPPPNLLPCGSVKSFAQEWDRTCRARRASL